MTRKEYLDALASELGWAQAEVRQAILDYYEEMIDDRMEDGMDEVSAVAAMEAPQTIAARLREDPAVARAEEKAASEAMSDEALRFSSLAGDLLRTFEDLEKAGRTAKEDLEEAGRAARENLEEAGRAAKAPKAPETPKAPEAPEIPETPEKPQASGDCSPFSGLFQSAEKLARSAESLVEDVTRSTEDYVQRHTTEDPSWEYEKKVFTCPASQVDAVRLLCREMPIRVKGCEGDELTLTYYTSKGDEYRVRLENRTLTLERLEGEHRGSRFTFSILGGAFKMFWNQPSPVVELLLPHDALVDLQAESGNSSVKVSDLDALCQVDLHTSNSRITVKQVNCKNLKCASSNGRLELEQVKSKQGLTGKTSNSRIEARSVSSGGDLTLTTSNSAILAENCAARQALSLTTSNGVVEIHRSTGASVSLKTSNGAVRGELPGRQQDWQIDSRTSNGHNSLPNSQPGDKPLFVRNSNGSIRLAFEE